MSSAIRLIVRTILLIFLVFPIGWIQSCLQFLKPRPAFYVFPQWLCKAVLAVLDVKLIVRGEKCVDHPMLFVPNHSSYLDIVVMQAVIGASFISKVEVKRWPVFGWLAQIQGTIFIHRNRGEAKQQSDALAERLKKGGDLILFAEGTTGDGCRILSVKSSLLGVAQFAKAVQPISIAFTGLDGLPPGRTHRWFYAWIGDESLVPHMLRVLGMGDMQLTITFHEPIRDELTNRKLLAHRIETTLREGLNNAITQRAA